MSASRARLRASTPDGAAEHKRREAQPPTPQTRPHDTPDDPHDAPPGPPAAPPPPATRAPRGGREQVFFEHKKAALPPSDRAASRGRPSPAPAPAESDVVAPAEDEAVVVDDDDGGGGGGGGGGAQPPAFPTRPVPTTGPPGAAAAATATAAAPGPRTPQQLPPSRPLPAAALVPALAPSVAPPPAGWFSARNVVIAAVVAGVGYYAYTRMKAPPRDVGEEEDDEAEEGSDRDDDGRSDGEVDKEGDSEEEEEEDEEEEEEPPRKSDGKRGKVGSRAKGAEPVGSRAKGAEPVGSRAKGAEPVGSRAKGAEPVGAGSARAASTAAPAVAAAAPPQAPAQPPPATAARIGDREAGPGGAAQVAPTLDVRSQGGVGQYSGGPEHYGGGAPAEADRGGGGGGGGGDEEEEEEEEEGGEDEGAAARRAAGQMLPGERLVSTERELLSGEGDMARRMQGTLSSPGNKLHLVIGHARGALNFYAERASPSGDGAEWSYLDKSVFTELTLKRTPPEPAPLHVLLPSQQRHPHAAATAATAAAAAGAAPLADEWRPESPLPFQSLPEEAVQAHARAYAPVERAKGPTGLPARWELEYGHDRVVRVRQVTDDGAGTLTASKPVFEFPTAAHVARRATSAEHRADAALRLTDEGHLIIPGPRGTVFSVDVLYQQSDASLTQQQRLDARRARLRQLTQA